MAQNSGSSNSTASSTVNIRIPSFAIITLADNNSKNISTKDTKVVQKSRIKEMGDIVSNREWAVNFFQEETSSGSLNSATVYTKSLETTAKVQSVTVVYVTSLN